RGPLPPFGSHTYVFKVFVLDTMLELDSEAGKSQVMKAMDGHILQYGTLTGQFEQVKE
ncbi:MAG: YbhB/YbcL family Raf kinase inhibitor-like protein, partial [Clostridiaceae bacterium]|nr:YbhB/YbcL family Raf kinase inhibitor-like protein [Clostridiaceae bacterium]